MTRLDYKFGKLLCQIQFSSKKSEKQIFASHFPSNQSKFNKVSYLSNAWAKLHKFELILSVEAFERKISSNRRIIDEILRFFARK